MSSPTPLHDPARVTLTLAEVATLLGVSLRTVQRQARTGNIAGVPVMRVSERRVVPAEGLRRALGITVDVPEVTVEGHPNYSEYF